MERMFVHCYSLTSIDMSHFNMENVKDLDYFMYSSTNLVSLKLPKSKASNLVKANHMFEECKKLISIDFTNFIVDSNYLTEFHSAFQSCSQLEYINLTNVNLKEVVDMGELFSDCHSLKSIDFPKMKINKLEIMNKIFFGCNNLKSLNLSNFNTENVFDMNYIFHSCSSLESINVSNFNTKNVQKMNSFFYGCSSLTSLDLSSLNGESLPRDVKEGEEIYSGSVNLSSVLLIKTSKAYQDSTLAKILDLVKNEQAKKTKTEKFISRFAKIYTPVVMLIALVVFLMGYGLSGWSWVSGGRVWLYKAASVLLIACPCALVIGVPLVFFSGIGAGSRLGVLIKGSVSLENLAKSNTFVFDKTGTLTKGNFVLENKPDPKVLQIAASLEAKSTHPLAKAIQKANKESLLEVTDFTNVTGYGIKGKIDGKEYLIGTKKFLLESGIPDFKEEETPFKVLYLGEAGKSYLASFIVRDEVKREAKDSLAALKANKVKQNIILSGDDKKIVSKVGEEVGADITYGELLPEEKLKALESKKKEGAKICYVGDGINDSPALLAADVGLAMGALGSDAAIEASDIVVMDDDLRKVAEAKRLADHTMRIVYLTITVALLLKIMFLVLVLTGALGEWAMVVSGFSDTGILLLCVLIAMTPLLYKPKYAKKSNEKDCPSKKDKKKKELVASLS